MLLEFYFHQFNRMSFRLVNAPGTFQRLLDQVLAPLKYNSCLAYIDDIVIFSRTYQGHIDKIEKVFQRLSDANLRMKPSECKFLLDDIIYLGRKVIKQSQQPDEQKIIAVKKFPELYTLKYVCSFVALCSYYRKFIQNFSMIAEHLTDLTRKNDTFV